MSYDSFRKDEPLNFTEQQLEDALDTVCPANQMLRDGTGSLMGIRPKFGLHERVRMAAVWRYVRVGKGEDALGEADRIVAEALDAFTVLGNLTFKECSNG